ncbi:hypothetical protein ACQUWW_26710, partial [Ralstonia pseudosolanacearum]|uniref:hypothetical protein n=1 Tax=Ralstonia pseudosolanacearum TaxID=1310165 RepID=UPI003D1754ED
VFSERHFHQGWAAELLGDAWLVVAELGCVGKPLFLKRISCKSVVLGWSFGWFSGRFWKQRRWELYSAPHGGMTCSF